MVDFIVLQRVSVILFYNSNGEILLQDRRNKSKWGEEYGFFGGVALDGESSDDALRRELFEELELKDFNFDLFKRYVHRADGVSAGFERSVYIADMPDISKLVCHEGKMEVRTFQDSFGLKMIPGFCELLREIYESLRAQDRIV